MSLRKPQLLLITSLLAALLAAAFILAGNPTRANTSIFGNADRANTSVTISGEVTGPGGADVVGAAVMVHSNVDSQETTTNASGTYAVTLQTEGLVWIRVRPLLEDRLSQANALLSNVTQNQIQDFSLVDGHLLNLRITGAGGVAVSPGRLEVMPLQADFDDYTWYELDWNADIQKRQAVMPPDIYYVTAPQPPAGYFHTSQPFDLRAADLDTTMPLNTSYVHPIPYDPPDASKITFSQVDDLGQATVTGSAGAALPLARVLLVNLSSGHQADAVSEANGSFNATIFAPPGSTVMIKHGPASHRWANLDMGLTEWTNPFPGTMIYVDYPAPAGPGELPFAAAGAISLVSPNPPETAGYVGAAWALTGTLSAVDAGAQWTRVLTGTYQTATVPGLYLGGLNWTHPALADLDDDTDLDLLVGADPGRLVLYRNLGSPTVPDWRFEDEDYADLAGEDWWAYPALADVTNDGAPDLFLGRGDGTLRIYYNDGTPESPLWPETADVVLTIGGHPSPAIDDLDGDGLLDLLVGYEWGTDPVTGSLAYIGNTGTASAPAWTVQNEKYKDIEEAGGWLQPAFMDLDNDADLDLLVGLCGQFIWYKRGDTEGSPTWTRQGDDPLGYGGGSCGTSAAVGDWDGNGSADAITGEHWGNLRFFAADGPASWLETPFEFPFDLQGDSAPALADWDNDGDLDMLVGQAHGDLHLYSNAGSISEPNWQPSGTFPIDWSYDSENDNHPHPFPTLADIDDDGDYDLFVGVGGWFPGSGKGGNIHYYQNEGTVFSPTWTLSDTNYLGLQVAGWSTPAFADIDNDDDLDLLVGDESGSLTFVENVGTAVEADWGAPQHPYIDHDFGANSAPSFIDVDQDGDLDLLVGHSGGSLAYVQNTGTITTPLWQVVADQYPGIDIGFNSTPAVGDLNGDLDPDLLIGDGDGGLNLYHYLGPGGGPPPADAYQPGDLFTIEGTIHLHGQAITATTDLNAVEVVGHMHWLQIANEEGRPLPAVNNFMSSVLTPSGLPILGARAFEPIFVPVLVSNIRYLGGHEIAGDFSVTGQIPLDGLAGTYRPSIFFAFTGVPDAYEWLAASVTAYTFGPQDAALPPITVGDPQPARLIWRLLADDFVQGTRGASARQDEGDFGLVSDIVTQGAPYYMPPVDVRTGQPITYRLEPFLPRISHTDRLLPTQPLLPFDLPGGHLCVTIRQPNGQMRDLGCEALAQSFNRTKTARYGNDINIGTVQLDDVYSLMAGSDRFRVTFDQYGHHVITMTGALSDTWGNNYQGGGTYDLWVAQPLDFDPGVLPGTPLAAGDAFNPSIQFYPRVPAQVTLKVTHYPESDPAQMEVHTIAGRANRFGYFFGDGGSPIVLNEPGEFRVDVTAFYTDPEGVLYMGAMTWGSIVMTPEGEAQLVAHGRRGVDSLASIPHFWFLSKNLNIPQGAITHSLNPYLNGDLLWSRFSDGQYGGDSLILGASVQELIKDGDITQAIQDRAGRMNIGTAAPGTLTERFEKDEIPLFSSTLDGKPVQFYLGQIDGQIPDQVDQIAYSYRSSQRPGVRVREIVAEDNQTGGYWRLDTLYDDQLSEGLLGDQVNDFKFQYVGVVYRDLQSGHNEYAGQGSGWIFIPDSDPAGSRVMPPLAGYGAWDDRGGPILTLKGEEIVMFILPTGVLPGAVLEVGDTFRFAGHLMPTLDSKVSVTVTAPGGAVYHKGGQANSVGYFYDPNDDIVVGQAGLWTVDVLVWHDGQIGDGSTVDCVYPPYPSCPSGHVLGSESGRYYFYVVPASSPNLAVTSPLPGFLTFSDVITPITISGLIPGGLSGATVDYTISMPGYILETGQATVSGNTFSLTFDPQALNADFPNLDLISREAVEPGLADTFSIGLLLRGQQGGQPLTRAAAVTIQGEQVFVTDFVLPEWHGVYLPAILR